MELRELVGLHELSGVDRLHGVEVEREYGGTECAEVLRFTLDGITYVAREDPSDGYRSMLRDVTVSDESPVNRFAPVQVFGVLRDRWGYGYRSEVLELLTMRGERVLAVGTENTDDYYPVFVAEFHPEALGGGSPMTGPDAATGQMAAKYDIRNYYHIRLLLREGERTELAFTWNIRALRMANNSDQIDVTVALEYAPDIMDGITRAMQALAGSGGAGAEGDGNG